MIEHIGDARMMNSEAAPRSCYDVATDDIFHLLDPVLREATCSCYDDAWHTGESMNRARIANRYLSVDHCVVNVHGILGTRELE